MSDIATVLAMKAQKLAKQNTSNTLARFIGKMLSGHNVTFAFIGDSVFQGLTASNAGVTDAASLICTQLSQRYGVTVTKSNRCAGGHTVATIQIDGYFQSALNDNADCYLISFGKNDIVSDISSPSFGYVKADSKAGLEYLIRRIRIQNPYADIILCSENPYSASQSSTNTYLQAYNKEMQHLAYAYGCKWIDAYQAFINLGSWDSYLSDGIHPNDAGHQLIANTVLSAFPSSIDSLGCIPYLPKTSLAGGVERYDPKGWTTITNYTRTAGTDGWIKSATTAFNNGTSAPYVSSTAGEYILATFTGSECGLMLDCGSGTGVVNIYVDGVKSTLDLTTLSSGQKTILLSGLGMGIHSVRVEVVSGTITWRGLAYLHAPAEYINNDSPRITYTGTWASTSSPGFYGGNAKYSFNANDSFTFDFVGSGFGVHMLRYPTGALLGITVDGVNYGARSTNTGGSTNENGAFLLKDDLEYGRHTVTINLNAVQGGSFQMSGIYIFDKKRLNRPTIQRGIAVVGEVITYAAPFSGRPVVRVNGGGSSNELATGFTVTGTAGATVIWEAEGSIVTY